MKIRSGFVSNSSSSSFVIASKKGELTKEKLVKAFGVDKKSLFYPVSVKMTDILENYSNKTDIKTLLDDWGYSKIEEFPKYIQEAYTKGIVYTGAVGSDGDEAEQLLCSLELNYEDEEIYIHKEGGY